MSMTRNEFKQEALIRMAAAKMTSYEYLVEDDCAKLCDVAEKLADAFESKGGEFYAPKEQR